MNTAALQELFVKESLFQFITENIPKADLNLIDIIVLPYIVSVVEDDVQDIYFDLNDFSSTMAAYVPNFGNIESAKVYAWLTEMEAQMPTKPRTITLYNKDDAVAIEKTNEPPQIRNKKQSKNNASNRSKANTSESESVAEGQQEHVEVNQCDLLHEMFPHTCTMELKHCVSIARGDMERAAATLLARREQGQALTGPMHPAHNMRPAAKQTVCDDHELKNRIIARYSYVDKNSENKEHKPLAPKIAPKKLVRYRDNKIVSLKGERYTEVPKSGAEEEHLKKPKKQHCP